MASEIKRMCCPEIPGVSFLCFENIRHEKIVLAHAHPFIGLCLGKSDRRTCAKAFRAFLDSDAGQGLKNGGDLRTAAQNGQLSEHIYTYRMRADGGGGAALFVTLEGVRQILHGLPNQEEVTKQKHLELFSSFLNPVSANFLQLDIATPEQCAKYDAEEVVEEIFTEGCAPVQGNDSTVVVTQKMWLETRLSSYESCAEKRVLEAQLQSKDAQLQAKDVQIAAANLVKAAEIAKERAEKESAQKEVVSVRESAAKDLQIAKLKMQLEMAEEMAKLRNEGRLERGEDQDKVQRLMPNQVLKKMHERDTLFSKLVSSVWSNDIVSVNQFKKLSLTNGESVVEPLESESVKPQLKIQFSTGITQHDLDLISDVRQRIFGFCYQGPALTEDLFRRSGHIKEAYGVEIDAVHYICLVLFKRSGREISGAASLPYDLGLLPCTTMAKIIPCSDHHITVYKTSVSTDDFVLEMVKLPSMEKWFWHSAGKDS